MQWSWQFLRGRGRYHLPAALMVALIAPMIAAPTYAVAAQTAPSAPNAEDERAAREAAEQILTLAAARDFNVMYDRIHPDAHAIIPRVVAVKSFEDAYGQTEAGQAEVTGLRFGDWTWAVNGTTYPMTAEVSFEQPAVDENGDQVQFRDRIYLVAYKGTWRWFFGSSRAFVADRIARYAPPPPADSAGDPDALIETVVGDLDTYYRDALAASEFRYRSPGVVAVGEGEAADTGCGLAQPGFWAFYCPADQTIYLDRPFLADLTQRYGDFAASFVVGHEWAHHVQTEIGIRRSEAPEEFLEVYSIELELMADCLTGTWSLDADTRGLLDLQDLAEAIAFTRERLGDPETVDPFDPQAHGSSEQRVEWFETGYEDGFEGCGDLLGEPAL